MVKDKNNGPYAHQGIGVGCVCGSRAFLYAVRSAGVVSCRLSCGFITPQKAARVHITNQKPARQNGPRRAIPPSVIPEYMREAEMDSKLLAPTPDLSHALGLL
jgi:hypothetical protein